jgi:hypothetical protein
VRKVSRQGVHWRVPTGRGDMLGVCRDRPGVLIDEYGLDMDMCIYADVYDDFDVCFSVDQLFARECDSNHSHRYS